MFHDVFDRKPPYVAASPRVRALLQPDYWELVPCGRDELKSPMPRYEIVNRVTGSVEVGDARNAHNGAAQALGGLKGNRHPNRGLQAEWNALG